MKHRSIRTFALAWSVIAGGVAGVGVRGGSTEAVPMASGAAAWPAPTRVPDDSIFDAGDAVVWDNLFRLSRQSASVETAESDRPAPPVPARVQPPVRLRATAGPPWSAVIDGLPGAQAGLVVGTGDVVGPYTVVHIGVDRVMIRDRDTTWTFAFSRP